MSLGHDAGTIGYQTCVQPVVETGPLGEWKRGPLFRADEEDGVFGQTSFVEKRAYLAGKSIKMVDLGVIRNEGFAQFGCVDPVRGNGEF